MKRVAKKLIEALDITVQYAETLPRGLSSEYRPDEKTVWVRTGLPGDLENELLLREYVRAFHGITGRTSVEDARVTVEVGNLLNCFEEHLYSLAHGITDTEHAKRLGVTPEFFHDLEASWWIAIIDYCDKERAWRTAA